MMKKKKPQFPIYEEIMAELVGIVGEKLEKNKITPYQAIGIFEAAKQVFVVIINERYLYQQKRSDNEN